MHSLRAQLKEITDSQDQALLHNRCYYGLSDQQLGELAKKDIAVYKGKVREVLAKGNDLLIVHTDRLTAFDRMIAMIPYKGLILAEISEFWLKEAGKIVPTHYLGRPDERIIHGRKTTPVKAEVVVRGYLAGSMLRAYESGERQFCGEKLEDGIKTWGKLPRNIITPTTKAAAFEHDENASAQELIASKVVSKSEWATISDMTHRLFEHGQKVFSELGWILVDTKYEFGRTATGEIILIDEIHTPDSSRLWEMSSLAANTAAGNSPVMFDKEVVRRYLLAQGFSGYGDVPVVPKEQLIGLAEVYLNVCERLVGSPLQTLGGAYRPDTAILEGYSARLER